MGYGPKVTRIIIHRPGPSYLKAHCKDHKEEELNNTMVDQQISLEEVTCFFGAQTIETVDGRMLRLVAKHS